MAKQLRKPVAFPVERPVACMREPVGPDAAIMGALRGVERGQREPIHEAFVHLEMGLAEAELCGLCDEVTERGATNGRSLGRGKAPRVIWGVVLPRGAKDCGRADALTLGLTCFSDCVCETACILFTVRRGREASGVMVRQWLAIACKLREPTGSLKFLVEHGAPAWRWRAANAGHLMLGHDFVAAAWCLT